MNFVQRVYFTTFLIIATIPACTKTATKLEKEQSSAETIFHLLTVAEEEYEEAVKDLPEIKQEEYEEAQKLVDQAISTGKDLVVVPALTALKQALEQKLSMEAIEQQVDAIIATLEKTYTIETTLTLPATPDMAKAEELYAIQCASCHGTQGDGQGPSAAKLDPKPAVLNQLKDTEAKVIFSVITVGIPGTGMRSYRALTKEDRLLLTSYVLHWSKKLDEETHTHKE